LVSSLLLPLIEEHGLLSFVPDPLFTDGILCRLHAVLTCQDSARLPVKYMAMLSPSITSRDSATRDSALLRIIKKGTIMAHLFRNDHHSSHLQPRQRQEPCAYASSLHPPAPVATRTGAVGTLSAVDPGSIDPIRDSCIGIHSVPPSGPHPLCCRASPLGAAYVNTPRAPARTATATATSCTLPGTSTAQLAPKALHTSLGNSKALLPLDLLVQMMLGFRKGHVAPCPLTLGGQPRMDKAGGIQGFEHSPLTRSSQTALQLNPPKQRMHPSNTCIRAMHHNVYMQEFAAKSTYRQCAQRQARPCLRRLGPLSKTSKSIRGTEHTRH
jgi:hypothetical protein